MLLTILHPPPSCHSSQMIVLSTTSVISKVVVQNQNLLVMDMDVVLLVKVYQPYNNHLWIKNLAYIKRWIHNVLWNKKTNMKNIWKAGWIWIGRKEWKRGGYGQTRSRKGKKCIPMFQVICTILNNNDSKNKESLESYDIHISIQKRCTGKLFQTQMFLIINTIT